MKKQFFLLLTLPIFTLFQGFSQNLTGVKIYINPGHGGYDSDDRNVIIAPYRLGDPNGFWESKSNLDKGLFLKEMLDSHGATTRISRVTNTTADDLPLSQIVRSANEMGADFMLSIHTNAGGISNHVLMLYPGKDPGDTNYYPSATPKSAESRAISEVIAKNLYLNQITTWGAGYTLRGDKTAARQWFGWSDGYGVLRGLTVPGVISEGAMHDYIPETYRLMNIDYKYLEAWNFFKSFAAYFKSETIPHGIIAGAVRDKFVPNPGNYLKIANSKDNFMPLNGATVKLVEKNLTYTTDNLFNGVFVFKNLEPGTYTLLVEATGYHSQTYTLTVTANNISYLDCRLNRIRNTPPSVVSYSPNVVSTDSVSAGSKITVKFNWDIDPNSAQNAFSITPDVVGKFIFKESNYVMEFIPDAPLEKATLYTVKIDKTLSHFDGLSMENVFSFQFNTKNRNELSLVAAYPHANDNRVHFEKPKFAFVFDRRLQTSDLTNNVQVYDSKGTVVNKMAYSTINNGVQYPFGSTSFTLSKDLVVGENYVVKIAKGVKDVDGVLLLDTLMIPFSVSDERKTDKLIVDNYETGGKLKVDTASSPFMQTATVSISSSIKLFDSYSYNLKYSFSNYEKGEVVYSIKEPSIEVTSDSTIGLHIYGDMSGNELFLLFASEIEIKEIKLDSIHYGGWKFAKAPLNSLIPNTTYRLIGYAN